MGNAVDVLGVKTPVFEAGPADGTVIVRRSPSETKRSEGSFRKLSISRSRPVLPGRTAA